VDIAGLVSSFATAASYTVTRTARGSTVRGRTSAGTQTTLTIVAAAVPQSLSLQRVAEGHTELTTCTVYTATELYAGGQDADYEADKITIDGSLWEVDSVQRYTDPRTRAIGYVATVTRE
jgi:hypothetical protein